MAIGYTLVYGIIELINFAHGEVFMIGSFVSVALFAHARAHDGDRRRRGSSSGCCVTLLVAMLACGDAERA